MHWGIGVRCGPDELTHRPPSFLRSEHLPPNALRRFMKLEQRTPAKDAAYCCIHVEKTLRNVTLHFVPRRLPQAQAKRWHDTTGRTR